MQLAERGTHLIKMDVAQHILSGRKTKHNVLISGWFYIKTNYLVIAIFKTHHSLSVLTTNVSPAKCYRSRSLLWTEVLDYEVTPAVDKYGT